MGYALFRYHQRASAIRRKAQAYDDRVGPTVLCAVLISQSDPLLSPFAPCPMRLVQTLVREPGRRALARALKPGEGAARAPTLSRKTTTLTALASLSRLFALAPVSVITNIVFKLANE